MMAVSGLFRWLRWVVIGIDRLKLAAPMQGILSTWDGVEDVAVCAVSVIDSDLPVSPGLIREAIQDMIGG